MADIDKKILKESLKGVRKMISSRRCTLSHITNHILGKPRVKAYQGGVAKSYVCNVNNGLKLARELALLREIKQDLLTILKKQQLLNP